MKTILLNPKSGYQDLVTYCKDLLDTLTSNHEVISYDDVKPDFSNIVELFDDSEKLLLFNQFSFDEGFYSLTKHLPRFKNVKYILSPYSAYEGLDLALLKKLGIKYRNNAGANAQSVAQYAITCMFMLLHKFPLLAAQTVPADGSTLGEEFHNKTVGIIGMGNVGQEIARITTSLGMNVVYFNRSKEDVDLELVPLDKVRKQDIIFITIATNPETIKLLSNIHTNLKDNYIVDVSAAADLYDKKKVLKLLNTGKIRGYALELFNPEEFDLNSDKNFIKTPHIAWCTVDAEKRTVVNYLERALTILNGKAGTVDFIV